MRTRGQTADTDERQMWVEGTRDRLELAREAGWGGVCWGSVLTGVFVAYGGDRGVHRNRGRRVAADGSDTGQPLPRRPAAGRTHRRARRSRGVPRCIHVRRVHRRPHGPSGRTSKRRARGRVRSRTPGGGRRCRSVQGGDLGDRRSARESRRADGRHDVVRPRRLERRGGARRHGPRGLGGRCARRTVASAAPGASCEPRHRTRG